MPLLDVGTVLGDRFELRGVLGTGGMATVWLAWDRVRKANVALKVLHPLAAASSSDRRRLQREVRATAALRHPAVLAPFDLHELDELVALSMPLHRGATLLDHVADGGPLDVEALYDLGIRVAGALGAAHDLGVLHRDVTPANVLLTGGREAMLADFGLARLAEHTATATRAMATPGYTAPEVFAGDRGDPRSDLYGLGASLYYAATGRSPFTGIRATTRVGQQLSGGHTPLSAVRPDLPRDLAATIEALLAPLASDRPATAADVARALTSRVTVTPSHAVRLESGDATLWVELGEEDALSRVLRRRGVVPGRVAEGVARSDRPWPAIRGISLAEAAAIGEALSEEGASWSVSRPPPPWRSRFITAALSAVVAVPLAAGSAGAIFASILWSGLLRATPRGPFSDHPVALVSAGVGVVALCVALSAVLYWQRPGPALGRWRGLADGERSTAVAFALAAVACGALVLPIAFLAPIAAWHNWFLVTSPTAGGVAFANFVLVGSWWLGLCLIGASGAGVVGAALAEFRVVMRDRQLPWYQVPLEPEEADGQLPETVAVARERLTSARRWLFTHAVDLPAPSLSLLHDCISRLQAQVEDLAAQSRALEAAAGESPDAALAAEIARIERRLERLSTLGQGDDALARELGASLAEHRSAIGRAEAIENRRLQIRAALVRIATTASSAVVALIGEDHGTTELLQELSATVADVRRTLDEVEQPEVEPAATSAGRPRVGTGT